MKPFQSGSPPVTPNQEGGGNGRPYSTGPSRPAESPAGASSITLGCSARQLCPAFRGSHACLFAFVESACWCEEHRDLGAVGSVRQHRTVEGTAAASFGSN